MLSLMSQKINVLIVGGGNAAFIKARTFVKKGSKVTVISKEFNSKFKDLEQYGNLKLIKSEYEKKYIDCNHIIVIATDSENINSKIRLQCIENYKLYIDCTLPEEGTCITPCQRNTEHIFLGINTLNKNPKASVYLADKAEKYLNKYDEFVAFTSNVRNNIKDKNVKKDIVNFMCSDDFFFFYEKGKAEIVLKIFYEIEG